MAKLLDEGFLDMLHNESVKSDVTTWLDIDLFFDFCDKGARFFLTLRLIFLHFYLNDRYIPVIFLALVLQTGTAEK